MRDHVKWQIEEVPRRGDQKVLGYRWSPQREVCLWIVDMKGLQKGTKRRPRHHP